MKKYLLLIPVLLILFSCSSKPAIQKLQGKKPFIVKNLTDFFIRCERDLTSAARVILEKDIIKNLSHLQFMNHGGKKFYILERESITQMIKSVTEGVYDDFVLINKQGKIIYTMVNNDIFAKNVRSKTQPQPLLNSYEKRAIPVYFQLDKLSAGSPDTFIFTSSRVAGGDTFPGIFILQVNANKILKLLDSQTEIIDMNGKYLVTKDKQKLDTQYKYFDRLDLAAQNNLNQAFSTTTKPGKTILYRFFRYRNIRWILIQK